MKKRQKCILAPPNSNTSNSPIEIQRIQFFFSTRFKF